MGFAIKENKKLSIATYRLNLHKRCCTTCLQRSWLEAVEGEEVEVGGVTAKEEVADDVGTELSENDTVWAAAGPILADIPLI